MQWQEAAFPGTAVHCLATKSPAITGQQLVVHSRECRLLSVHALESRRPFAKYHFAIQLPYFYVEVSAFV